MSGGPLERAVLEALAYSDIFDQPLTWEELHRYLPARAGAEDLFVALVSLNGQVKQRENFYFLAGRDEIVEIRKGREARSKKFLPIAVRYGRILGSFPFVRMAALTGSLAVLNVSKAADFDYMLVTAPGRVWTARAFALLLNRFARLFGHTLCPNLIVAETALEWPLHDLYSARELIQMIPITGMGIYKKLMKTNEWAKGFFPNAYPSLLLEQSPTKQSPVQLRGLLRCSLRLPLAMIENVLRGKLGDYIERWEMTRKIARFAKQDGFGEETVFTAEVCQGNFHHHRKWTKEVFEEKLTAIASLQEAIPQTISGIASSPIGSSQ